MKGINKVIMIVVIGFIVVSFFEDWRGINSQSQSKENSKPVVNTVDTYAYRAADNTWPAISEGQTQTIVADNLGTKNYYLVFDASGSMNEISCSRGQDKIAVAKSSVMEFITKIPADANIGLLAFYDGKIFELAALGSSSRKQAIDQINRIAANGGTPLKTSIEHAYKALSIQAVKQLGYGEYHMVVVTDGEASKGEDPRSIVMTMISHSPIVLHTIGFCISGDHSLNQRGLSIYKSANNPMELAKGLDSVLAEASDFSVDSFEE